MKFGASIVNTSSIDADRLISYATIKGAIQNFTEVFAQSLADKGIRANSVAPGPIWTSLIPSAMPPEKIEKFGARVPMKPATSRER